MIRHKFLIGDVLKKVTTKKLPLKAKTLPKIMNGDKSLIPLMAAGVENQGCVGYVNPNEPTVLHNLITVSANGANSGATFYQQRKFSILQDAYALELVDKYADYASDNVYLYLTAVVDHRLKDNGYNNKATWNRIKNYYIELPVTPAGDPDFEYMTARIRELEAERIRELEAYLHVTGLDDTTPSASEAQALTQKVQWKKFRVGDLFTINTGSLVSSKELKKHPGKTPRISVTTENNGIVGYYDEMANINNIRYYQNFISVNFFGNVFYHPEKASVEMKVHVLHLKSGMSFNRGIALYLVAALSQVFDNGTYNYGNQLSSSKLKKENYYIALPVTPTGDIDFDYMQNYIRATEKQTIKGVVEYKDRVIKETKKVVGE